MIEDRSKYLNYDIGKQNSHDGDLFLSSYNTLDQKILMRKVTELIIIHI